MSVILAIDAAWTEGQPSGVAVAVSSGSGWQCKAVAPSYEAFIQLSEGSHVDWNAAKFSGTEPDAGKLLKAAHGLAGARVDIVTIDMPVSINGLITCRREADNEISRVFGGRKCSVHSPIKDRPGRFGERFTQDFKSKGFKVATKDDQSGTTGRLVEVYPHTALLALLNRPERVKYKVSKSKKYWKDLHSPQDRISALLVEHKIIYDALSTVMDLSGTQVPIPNTSPTLIGLKRYEDALDALICAWVGIIYLEGGAEAYGDETAAIWSPREERRG